MNILLSIISFITALELRSLIYDNKLYIYPAKRRGKKTLSDFMFERNVGLGVRLKKFVLRSEDHLTVNDFWRILGKNNDELTRKNHILRLVDDKLRISPFVTPVDGVTIFSILLDLLKLPENCYIFLVVDDTEIKEIAKDAIQAFSNVNLLLRFILPKSLVLALDGFLKGRVQKKYLLVVNTSGKKSVFSFYTTCKGHKKKKQKGELDQSSKTEDKEAKNESKENERKNINDGYAIKLTFAHETDIISDVTIKNTINEFIRKSVEKAYNKFRKEERNLEPVEVGYYPFDYDRKKPEYYFHTETIYINIIEPIQRRAASHMESEIHIYNTNGSPVCVIPLIEFDLNDLHKEFDDFYAKKKGMVTAFEGYLVNSILEFINDKNVTSSNLLRHVDVICHGISMELNFVKQFFEVLRIKKRKFMYRYGLGANYYRPSRVKDDRVYDVESIPEINTEKYEKIMFEIGVYETAKKLASNNDKIQSNHPIVREIEELKEKIYRSDHELTFDQYRYFVNNYERIASEYDERRVEVTRTDLLKQIQEIEVLESTNPGLYKAVKPTYEAVKEWYEQNKNKNEITCHDFIRCRGELITALEAAKEGKIVDTAGQGLNKELTPDNKRLEAPPASDITASKIRNTRRKQKKAANVFEKVFKGFYRWWLRVLHIARDESDDVQSRDVFEEIPNRTKLERKIPRSIDPSFGDGNQNLDESEEAEDENKYNRGRQREYIHEEL